MRHVVSFIVNPCSNQCSTKNEVPFLDFLNQIRYNVFESQRLIFEFGNLPCFFIFFLIFKIQIKYNFIESQSLIFEVENTSCFFIQKICWFDVRNDASYMNK